jgi:preprotein translocase subunit SecA
MHRMERNLVLDQLDSTWKHHLLTMDHLRSSINLYGVAQAGDPKLMYKREGMKEFEQMWKGFYDRVTDSVFRMEDQGADAYHEALFLGAKASQACVQSSYLVFEASGTQAQQQQVQESQTNRGDGSKKIDPIRNHNPKVGRNDPCPCGSGKKFKNCHMRQASAMG